MEAPKGRSGLEQTAEREALGLRKPLPDQGKASAAKPAAMQAPSGPRNPSAEEIAKRDALGLPKPQLDEAKPASAADTPADEMSKLVKAKALADVPEKYTPAEFPKPAFGMEPADEATLRKLGLDVPDEIKAASEKPFPEDIPPEVAEWAEKPFDEVVLSTHGSRSAAEVTAAAVNGGVDAVVRSDDLADVAKALVDPAASVRPVNGALSAKQAEAFKKAFERFATDDRLRRTGKPKNELISFSSSRMTGSNVWSNR
jgi:hypothetical protein